MRLVVDASTLIAEVLRARGRKLLEHPDLDLLIATEAWDETKHELRKRTALVARRWTLSETRATELLEEALAVITSRVNLVSPEIYTGRLVEAQQRVPRDSRDVPSVALALVFDCGIWTGDYDFFGCGLPVWTTETLQLHLEDLREASELSVKEVVYAAFTRLGDDPELGCEVVLCGHPGEARASVEARARDKIATDDMWGAVGNLVADEEGRASPDPQKDSRNVLQEKEFLVVIPEDEAEKNPTYKRALQEYRLAGDR